MEVSTITFAAWHYSVWTIASIDLAVIIGTYLFAGWVYYEISREQ